MIEAGQRPAPSRLCSGVLQVSGGRAVPAPACALEREDGLCGRPAPLPRSLRALGRGSGWLRVGRAVVKAGGVWLVLGVGS